MSSHLNARGKSEHPSVPPRSGVIPSRLRRLSVLLLEASTSDPALLTSLPAAGASTVIRRRDTETNTEFIERAMLGLLHLSLLPNAALNRLVIAVDVNAAGNQAYRRRLCSAALAAGAQEVTLLLPVNSPTRVIRAVFQTVERVVAAARLSGNHDAHCRVIFTSHPAIAEASGQLTPGAVPEPASDDEAA